MLNNKKPHSFLFSFICLLTEFLFFCTETLAFLVPSLKKQFYKNRDLKSILESQQKQQQDSVVFYCSSAGEYLQIEPLIRTASQKLSVHIFFFSVSGINYAKNKNIPFHYSLSPRDSARKWRTIMDYLQPKLTIINRHELWPNFIKEAKKHGPLCLVNFSQEKPPGFLKKILLSQFTKIFCSDPLTLSHELGIGKKNIHYVSDTKYDYVYERKQSASLEKLEEIKGEETIVLGSLWKEDLNMLTEMLTQHPEVLKNKKFILCPHELSLVPYIQSQLSESNIPYELFSKSVASQTFSDKILIIDTVGHLFELYGISDFAYVGGALHHKVHNVLEPIAFNVPTSFGPLYHNSLEAKKLVENNLATIVQDGESFYKWLKNSSLKKSELRSQMGLHLSKHLGGSEEIIKTIGLL